MTIPRKFTLQTAIKVLRVERQEVYSIKGSQGSVIKESYWRIWLTANGDFTLGTFIQLLDNGKVNRVTWHEDGTESVFEMEDT
jgi:hypothetical protein